MFGIGGLRKRIEELEKANRNLKYELVEIVVKIDGSDSGCTPWGFSPKRTGLREQVADIRKIIASRFTETCECEQKEVNEIRQKISREVYPREGKTNNIQPARQSDNI